MSSFSRKHYKMIAAVISKMLEDDRKYFADKVSQMFEEDNPAFDKEKFVRACGV